MTKKWREENGVFYLSLPQETISKEEQLKRLLDSGYKVSPEAQNILLAKNHKRFSKEVLQIAIVPGSPPNYVHENKIYHQRIHSTADIGYSLRMLLDDEDLKSMNKKEIIILGKETYQNHLSIKNKGRLQTNPGWGFNDFSNYQQGFAVILRESKKYFAGSHNRIPLNDKGEPKWLEDDRMISFKVTSCGQTKEDWEKILNNPPHPLSHYNKSILNKLEPSTGITTEVVILKGHTLPGTDALSAKNILITGQKMGLGCLGLEAKLLVLNYFTKKELKSLCLRDLSLMQTEGRFPFKTIYEDICDRDYIFNKKHFSSYSHGFTFKGNK